jgi:hypothetical protein
MDTTASDIGTGAIVMPYAIPKPAPKAPDVARENDGRRQLVGYLGWKTILQRLAARQS